MIRRNITIASLSATMILTGVTGSYVMFCVTMLALSLLLLVFYIERCVEQIREDINKLTEKISSDRNDIIGYVASGNKRTRELIESLTNKDE